MLSTALYSARNFHIFTFFNSTGWAFHENSVKHIYHSLVITFSFQLYLCKDRNLASSLRFSFIFLRSKRGYKICQRRTWSPFGLLLKVLRSRYR